MKTLNVISFILLVFGSIAIAAEVKSPAVLLQEGLYAEETEGNLDKAMEIYSQIREKYNDVERISAIATYQLGLCYLKKDENKKAAELFEEVVSYYPQQTVAVKKAQQQLDKIQPAETKTFLTPTVIATVPANYSSDVSPERNEISVTFDQTMQDGSWSWVRWNYPFPETTGDPRYDITKTTCTLPVKLEPGKAYLVRINTEPEYMGFRSNQGISAQPYVLVFATKDKNGNPTPIPQDMLTKAKEINATKPAQLYTQEMHNEIEPDGTIKFSSPNRIKNKGAKPITNTGFINSDFVTLEKITDDKGRPIKFTASHEGNIYRYDLTFNEPTMPGEELVYTTYGTMTGLINPTPAIKDAYQYYMSHSPNSGAPTLRIETYLLPAGAELISTTPSNMQQTEKNGRIELRVEKVIPAGGSLTTAFQYKLAPAEPLKLEPAPWVDGEVMELRLKRPTGNEYGTIIYSAQRNKNNWQIISHMHVSEGSISQYTFVEADAESFAPIYGQTTNWTGNFAAEYGKENVRLSIGTDAQKSTQDISINGVAYDNEQAIYLIRRMPLAEGYKGSFPIFTVQSSTTVECRIKVLDVEEIVVEAGTFKCYKTDLAIYAQGTKTLQHTLWFSADEHKYLVKYDVGGSATMELAKVWQKSRNEPITFKNTKPPLSVAIPADWRFYKYNSGPQTLLQLIPPDLKAWALLVWQKRGTDAHFTSAMTIAKGDCEKLKGFFENYTDNPESWKQLEVGGLEAAQYIANYQDSGSGLKKYSSPKEMAEYRTYIVDASNVYWFVFRIEKDKFEENKAELDLIINSFKTNAK